MTRGRLRRPRRHRRCTLWRGPALAAGAGERHSGARKGLFRSTNGQRIHNSRRHEHARRASGSRGPRFRDRRRPYCAARRRRLSRRSSTRSTRASLAAASRRLCPAARSGGLASTPRDPRRSFGCRAGSRWSGSRPRARSAGTRRGRSANGRAPTRSRCSSCSRSTPSPLGEVGRAKGPFRWVNALAHRLRDNAPGKARQNIAAHYDLGNDFYSAWLDETMTYSSARFASAADSLEDAQLRKVQRLLDRLDLKPGQRLLDIGCGWGTLAIEAAKRGASVVGLTLSTEQKAWAERKIAEAGLAGQDRDPARRIIATPPSSSMPSRRSRWSRRSAGAGGAPISTHRAQPQARRARGAAVHQHRSPDFRPLRAECRLHPDLHLPRRDAARRAAIRGAGARTRSSAGRTASASGCDYAETLKRWRERYNQAVARGLLTGFEEPFHNLWRYYLMYCEGGFRGGAIDVAQVTMVKG